MSKPPSNARRFVNAAWSLLTFQVIASAGAVVVTGWAALHVQQVVSANSSMQQAGAAPEATIAPPWDGAAPPAAASADPSETPAAAAPADAAAPGDAPADAAPAATPAEAASAQVTPSCPRAEQYIRVPAQMGWCDTGFVLRRGQTVVLSVNAHTLWSNAGPPSKGPEGFAGYRYAGTIVAGADLASLIGRVGETSFAIGGSQSFVSPADGPLSFSINDTPGDYGDNQGFLDISAAVPTDY